MTTTAQRPSRPPLAAPPSGPLPALPKPRKVLSDIPDAPESRPGSPAGTSSLPTPTSKLPSRSVSSHSTPKPAHAQSTPSVPTLRTSDASPTPSALPTPGKSLRKTTSIGQFPLPPKGTPRTSLPPSPLSTTTSLSDANGQAASRRDSGRQGSADSGTKKLRGKSSGYGSRARASLGGAAVAGTTGSPSLTNGTGESNFISSAAGARGSESLLSLPSPPQSRSPSVDGSYMTDGTAFEDVGEDVDRGRPESQDTVSDLRRNSGDKDNKGNVLVSVRVRPDAGGSESSRAEGEWMVDGRRSLVTYRGKEGGDYRYDNVFSPHDQNSRVYDSAAKRLVRRVMEGYHGTVFAYGMTGTGKTFSMQGTANSPGVIPLAITDIFSYIRENPSREFLLRVSYLEIYNEKIYDLLSQSTPGQLQQEEIKLREDSKRGVYATPLKEEIVQSPNQLLRVIARGDLARRTGSTQFNARSSRSHAVVQIVVESRERAPSHGGYYEKDVRRNDSIMPGGVLVSTLSLIDLAGSERAAENKERRTEGAHINKSLLTLGTVIGRLAGEEDKAETGRLVDKEKNLKHLPYRDSKLTRLLQPALSGDSLVSILCTIQLSEAGSAAAATSHTGETLNTLKFASRAKNNIVSHAKRNESNAAGGDAGSRALLDRYRFEIQELRSQLEQQNRAKEEAERHEEIQRDREREEELERQERTRHEEQMLEMQLARTALKERIGHLNRLILSSKSLGVNSGRFSSASNVPLERTSTASANDRYGRPVSARSRDSMASLGRRASTQTLEVPLADSNRSSGRTVSGGSITMGTLPASQMVQMVEEGAVDDEEQESAGDDGEGHASLAQQNRALQADLTDKNRYIATLEKRLLQARRASRSKVGNHLLIPSMSGEESPLELLVEEKDREIEDLRARLDDQTRMVSALRSAARKIDAFDHRKPYANESEARPATAQDSVHAEPAPGAGPSNETTSNSSFTAHTREPSRPTSSRASYRTSTNNNNNNQLGARSVGLARTSSSDHASPPPTSHRSNPSTTSRSSSSVVNFSKTPLSPIALLGPSEDATSSSNSHYHHHHHYHHRPESDRTSGSPRKKKPSSAANGSTAATRRKSVDEMTMLLDQMISEKVESGQVLRGDRGSLRVKRDTVMERGESEREGVKQQQQQQVGGAAEAGRERTG
ncbi:hypothetical protein MBLNU230_g5910t1 [Neophaeotheca triangularis]